MTDRLFLQGPQNLLAITVNGSVIVESEEERQRSEAACCFSSQCVGSDMLNPDPDQISVLDPDQEFFRQVQC